MSPKTTPASVSTTQGKLKVHLEIVPGTRAKAALLDKVRRNDSGLPQNVVVAYVNERDRELFSTNAKGVVFVPLMDSGSVSAIVDYSPALVIVPCLTEPELSAGQHQLFLDNVVALLNNNLNVESSFPIIAYEGVNDMLYPAIDWPGYARLGGNFLRQYVYDYIVHDVTPEQIVEMYLAGDLHWPDILNEQRSNVFKKTNLLRLREGMFLLVGAHSTDMARMANPALRDLPGAAETNGWWSQLQQIALGLITVTCTALTLHELWQEELIRPSAATMILLAMTVLVALRSSLGATMVTAWAAILLYDTLFLHPFFSFIPTTTMDLRALWIFSFIAGGTAYLVNTQHRGLSQQRNEAAQTRALLRLVFDMTYIEDTPTLIQSALHNLQRTLGLTAAVVLTKDGTWDVFPAQNLTHLDTDALNATLEKNTILRSEKGQVYLWCPLNQGDTVIGAMGLKLAEDDEVADANLPAIVFLRTYCGLLASAIRRNELKSESVEAGTQASRESLRAALLSSVSHDLKTPLVSIIGSLSTLEFTQDGLPREERLELIHAARGEAERLHSIVHNVLELTKLESGSIIPRKDPVNVSEIVKDTATRVARAHPRMQFDLTNSKSGKLMAHGDAFLLSQLFYNLIDNAAKYGDASHPIDCVISDSAGMDAIVVKINDRGPGVPLPERDKIFDKFYRSSFTDHKQAGSGLGLAISRAITLSHGGDIRVGDRDDGLDGAQFEVTLPAAAVNMDVSEAE